MNKVTSSSVGHQTGTAQHGQRVVQRLVSHEMLAQHRIPPYFGLLGLQNRRDQRQQRFLPTLLILRQQLIGEDTQR
ncbi:hypothetical protein ACWEP4_31640 [Streptomyces sp. NPDC004227]